MGIPNSIPRDSLEFFHANVELMNVKTARKMIPTFAGQQEEKSKASALMICARRGCAELVDALLDKELKLQDVLGQTALHKALIYRHTAIAPKLLAERDICDCKKTTCLMFAAMAGSMTMVDEFIGQMHAKDSLGRTALMKAAIYGDTCCAEKLLDEAGQQDVHGKTACALAAQRGYWKIVGLLYPREGSILDDNDASVKDLALQMEQFEVVAYLENGAPVCEKLPKNVLASAKTMRKQAELTKIDEDNQPVAGASNQPEQQSQFDTSATRKSTASAIELRSIPTDTIQVRAMAAENVGPSPKLLSRLNSTLPQQDPTNASQRSSLVMPSTAQVAPALQTTPGLQIDPALQSAAAKSRPVSGK